MQTLVRLPVVLSVTVGEVFTAIPMLATELQGPLETVTVYVELAVGETTITDVVAPVFQE
jgi:hypothetical protein